MQIVAQLGRDVHLLSWRGPYEALHSTRVYCLGKYCPTGEVGYQRRRGVPHRYNNQGGRRRTAGAQDQWRLQRRKAKPTSAWLQVYQI